MKTLIIIPAYNEEKSILKTVNSIIEYNKSQIRLLFNSGIISVNAILENYPLREEDNLHNQE